MTLKALTAILFTVAISVAAMTSEHRRMRVQIELDRHGDTVRELSFAVTNPELTKFIIDTEVDVAN